MSPPSPSIPAQVAGTTVAVILENGCGLFGGGGGRGSRGRSKIRLVVVCSRSLVGFAKSFQHPETMDFLLFLPQLPDLMFRMRQQ